MRTNQAFYRFLEQVEREADALILAGDIFNVWFGDDLALRNPPAWLKQALGAFIECTKHVPVYFIHGNRDFLLGHQVCQSINAHLLPEQTLIQSDAGLLYVSHGDEFCTDDIRYMAIRRKLRNPHLQAIFRTLPLSLRRAIARYARHLSQKSQQKYAASQAASQATSQTAAHNTGTSSTQPSTPLDAQVAQSNIRFYDVNEDAIEQALLDIQQALGQLPKLVIHGHTHRPALHTLPNLTIPRIVLPDWDFDHQPEKPRGGYLKVEKKSVSLLPFENDSLTPISLDL